MKIKNIIIIISVILLALTFIGCIGVDNDFREVKSLVIKSTNEKFYKDVEFSVGSVGISIARMVASFNDDDEDAQAILKNISQVQVGVYKRSKFKGEHYNCSFFKDIDKKLKNENWHFIVKHVEGDELTGIYVKFDDGLINKLYVINLEDDKLSLVRVEGQLDNIIAYAIKNKGFDKVSFQY
ncbi:MAG: DUF4252 domain-containing protein [Ignavibacteriaceae bacterium]